MICPMLWRLPMDDRAAVNRECIREVPSSTSSSALQPDAASTAMFRAADDVARVAGAAVAAGTAAGAAAGGAAPDPGATAVLAEIDRHLTEMRKDLLHSSLEVQGVVREAGQAVLEQVASSGQILDALRAALEQRIDGLEGRLQAALQQRLDDLAQELSGALAHRLEGFERVIGETANPLRRALEESMGTLAARLDEASSDRRGPNTARVAGVDRSPSWAGIRRADAGAVLAAGDRTQGRPSAGGMDKPTYGGQLTGKIRPCPSTTTSRSLSC
jgi:hypothetical protein